jgi:hypothetical protein
VKADPGLTTFIREANERRRRSVSGMDDAVNALVAAGSGIGDGYPEGSLFSVIAEQSFFVLVWESRAEASAARRAGVYETRIRANVLVVMEEARPMLKRRIERALDNLD